MIKRKEALWPGELEHSGEEPYFGAIDRRLGQTANRYTNRIAGLLKPPQVNEDAEDLLNYEQGRVAREDRFPPEFFEQPVNVANPERKTAYDAIDRLRRDEIVSLTGSGLTGAAVGGGLAAGGAYLAGAPVLQSTILGGLGVLNGAYIGAAAGIGLYGLGKLHQHLSGKSHQEHGVFRTMTTDAAQGFLFGIPKIAGHMWGRMTGQGGK